MTRSRTFWTTAAVLVAGFILHGQQSAQRPLSPPGTAATQVGGRWVKDDRGERYEGGKWIDVVYNRPLLRTRTGIFGSGADYGKKVGAGAPVWRAGANQSTRFRTEVPLTFGGKTLPAGEYSLFVDLKPEGWTLIFSNWGAQQKFDPNDKSALWGSYNYTADKDVLRAPMQVSTLPMSIDQLSIGFADVTENTGKLVIWWDTTQAIAPFTVAGA